MSRWLIVLMVIAPSAFGQGVWFVDKDNVSGTEDGTSWATAFSTIQPGIDAAAAAGGGEVWVAEGVYDEIRVSLNDDDVDTGSLVISDQVTLVGGFLGDETLVDQRDMAKNATTIDGSSSRAGSAAYHVVLMTGASIIDGFTVTGGNALGGFGSGYGGSAGINCRDAEVAIRHCTIIGNKANLGPGGLGTANTSLRASHSRFISNDAGAISLGSGDALIEHCVFQDNVDDVGAAIRAGGTPLQIHGCLFEGNRADDGSAIMASAGRVDITNSIFVGNRCDAPDGKAVYMESFFGFEAGFFGELTVVNSTFYDNNTEANQSALAFQAVDEFKVQNTIIRESVGIGINKILDDGFDSRRVTALHNNVSGGIPWNDGDGNGTRTSQGNIDTDPSFVDPDNADFRLMEGSPSIDTGLLEDAPDEDINGVPRPQGEGVDMGAHEDPANFDPNKDGAIDAVDVQMIINAALGLSMDDLDINNDNAVNAIDVQLIINAALGLLG